LLRRALIWLNLGAFDAQSTEQDSTMKKGTFAWPKGQRIAVAVTVMLEQWSEGKAPPWGVQGTHLKPGTLDRGGISWGTYGGKIGVWRIMNMLRQNGVRGTFGVNARCAELWPDATRAILRSGHDIAGHGYLQDHLLAYMTPQEERDSIKKSLAVLEEITGQRPAGWISPVLAWTEHTSDYLAAEGLAWHGDWLDIDLPRAKSTKNGPIAYIPASDFTDSRVARASPQVLWDVYKDTFDYLYLREAPAYLGLTLHCHFGGRPLVCAVFDKILKYFAQFPDVWFASHGEIARWTLDENIEAETYARRAFESAEA
jgi:peptidoglycan/xylan/chitin deacetylase (PgdA/CDA1 family)